MELHGQRGFRLAHLKNLIEENIDLIIAIIAISGLIYLTPKAVSISGVDGPGGLDFRVIWIAANMWASGQDPYGPSFTAEYFKIFGPGPGALWFYPPYWYPIALPFSSLPFSIANSVWKLANASLLIGAIHFIARALADVTHQKYITIFLAGVAYASFMQATSVTLYIGQTSILVFFGFAALIYGILKTRHLPIVVGLVFLALKPQFGIVAFASIAALRHYRWAMIAAIGICLVATVPLAVTGHFRESIDGFLTNLPRLLQVPGNDLPNLTGLMNITGYVFQKSFGFFASQVLVVAAILFAFVIMRNLSTSNAQDSMSAQHRIACLVMLLASTFLFVPLHTYDLVSISAILMMIMATSLTGRWLIVLGLLLCLRPINLWQSLGIANPEQLVFPESHLVSASLLVIFLGAVVSILSSRSQTHPANLALND